MRKTTLGARAGLVTLLVAVLSVSACGSSGDNTASGSGGGGASGSAACISAANDYLKAWQTLPTALPASPPSRYSKLPSVPPKGKYVVNLSNSVPASQTSNDAMEAAAKLLGWKFKEVIFDSTVPDLQAKFDQILAQNPRPDYIIELGTPAEAFQSQIDAAKKDGVNVIVGTTTGDPVSSPGLMGVAVGTNVVDLSTDISAYKMLQDSKCTGHTVVFSADFPILAYGVARYKKTVSKLCPKCKIDVVTVQPKDIGTPAMIQQEVTKLQATPDAKYAYTLFGDLASGLAPALRTAGITDVNIFGQTPNAESIAALRNGTNAWWVNQSGQTAGYDSIDMAARNSVDGKVQSDKGGYPLALLTKDNVPSGSDLPITPANQLDLYAQLWGVK